MILLITVLVIGSGFAQGFAQDTLNQRKPVTTDRDLVIQPADITENAIFFPVVVDGTQMEVLAVKAPDGTIRTAFTTCQICYASGRGYFV
jgi:hypothetical protein